MEPGKQGVNQVSTQLDLTNLLSQECRQVARVFYQCDEYDRSLGIVDASRSTTILIIVAVTWRSALSIAVKSYKPEGEPLKSINEKIKEKIKKLLSLATSDNENEAAIAMRKAMQLMSIHSITESDLKRSPIINKRVLIDFKVWPVFLSDLFCYLSSPMGCYSVYRNARGLWREAKASGTIIGLESDVINFEYVFHVASKIIRKRSIDYSREQSMCGHRLSRKEINDYRSGLAIGFCEKVKVANSENQPVGCGLVSVDDRANKAECFYLNGSKVETQSNNRTRSQHFTSGFYDGEKINVNPGVDGNYTSQPLIGCDS